MKILLIGANGRMGQAMQKVMAQKGIEFFGVDKDNRLNAKSVDCDVIVDFSSADALEDNLSLARKKQVPIVIATTGHGEKNLQFIQKAKDEIAIFLSSNFSMLFNVMLKIIDNFQKLDFCEFLVEETHHRFKKDSPSGSCKELIKKLQQFDLPFTLTCHRVGDVVGEHKIKIYGENEALELSHNALSREVFCNGALKACEFISSKQKGLYSMQDLI